MKTYAALFIHPFSIYKSDPECDPWDAARDARRYNLDLPIVAHPPCNTWVPVSRCNYRMGEAPPYGLDDGCFEAALYHLNRVGGVIEHPAYTRASRHFGLPEPAFSAAWLFDLATGLWCIEVDQFDYGHKCRKRTWLWARTQVTPPKPHPARPGDPAAFSTLSKKQRVATPPAFKEFLKEIGRDARGVPSPMSMGRVLAPLRAAPTH